MTTIKELWHCKDESFLKASFDNYWHFVKPQNIALERELDNLNPDAIMRMGPNDWQNFLLYQYFRWKFTAPNRLATTTKQLMKYEIEGKDVLFSIKERLFTFNKADIEMGLKITTQIKGLGIAGASGLLSSYFLSILERWTNLSSKHFKIPKILTWIAQLKV